MSLADRLAGAIDELRVDERVLVAFDGPDAAGKTTLADEVERRLRRPVLRVSIDGWHHPRETRLRRGAESPAGYYLDSFDLPALVGECLAPFRGGASRVRIARFDHRTDETVQQAEDVTADTSLLVDGVFLLRPELRDLWDLAVYLHVAEEVTLRRAIRRDLDLFGGEDEVRRRYTRRYLPGQALYREIANPHAVADVLVDYADPDEPVVLRWPGGR